MNERDIQPGLRVRSPRRAGGTCTGKVDAQRQVPVGLWRAEVTWDDGGTRWPLVSILEPLPAVTP